MNKIIVNELMQNPKLLEHLKEHSYYVKMLNRNPLLMKNFKKDMKIIYHERPSDKVSDAIDGVEMIASVLDTI